MRIRSSYVVILIGVVIFCLILAVVLAERMGLRSGPGQARWSGELPQIELEKVAVDLGTIPNDKPTHTPIKVFNRGKGKLQIVEVAGGCSCVWGAIDKAAIAPGDFATLKVTFDPFLFPGFQTSKMVVVRSNDPVRPVVPVEVTTKIDPEFALEPALFDFGEVPKGDTVEKTAILRQVGQIPVEVLDLQAASLPTGFKVSYDRRPENEWTTPGKPEYVIRAQVAPEMNRGPFSVFIKVMTTCKRFQQGYAVVAQGAVKSFYDVAPSSLLVWNEVEPGQTQFATVTIKANTPVEVSDVVLDLDGVAASVRQEKDPNVAYIDFDIKEAAQPGRFKGQLQFLVHGNGRVVPERLPLIGRVVAKGSAAPQSSRSPA